MKPITFTKIKRPVSMPSRDVGIEDRSTVGDVNSYKDCSSSVKPVGDIKIDMPFVLSQSASILANQLGDGYVQVVVLNIALIVAAKVAFFVRKIIVMRLPRDV